MNRHIRIGLAMAVLLPACSAPSPRPAAPPEGQVGYTLANSAIQAGARLQLADNESFQPPLPKTDNAPPRYPVELLAQDLPSQAICLRLAIDEKGHVVNAVPVDQGSDCSGAVSVDPAFHAAAITATSRWQFDPAFRCVFPEGQTPDSACGFNGSQEIPQSISLVFRFVFEQVSGQGQVRID